MQQNRRIIEIIQEECKQIENLYSGYQEHLMELLSEIVSAEREHRTRATNIQQQISEHCNAAGRVLAKYRDPSGELD